MLSEYILVGRVLKPQGIDGLVKVQHETASPERFCELEHVYALKSGQYVCLEICDVQVRGGFVYLRLDGAQTRNDAEMQRDLELYVDRQNARPLQENEYFICDLIGCKGFDSEGKELGIVTDIMQPGANDVYVFKTPSGEMLVPALKSVILSVDLENQRIILDKNRLKEVAVFS